MFGLILAAALAAADPLPAFAEEPHDFRIASADATRAIHEFGNQSGIQILASAEQLAGKRLKPVVGSHTTDDALKIFLADTGLTHRYVGERTVALVQAAAVLPGGEGKVPVAEQDQITQEPSPGAIEEGAHDGEGRSVAQAETARGESQELPAPEDVGMAIPEILVRGSRSLNMDIHRTRDGVQPHVVFDRELIERSGAPDIQTFLRDRLTSLSSPATPSQQAQGSSVSTLNLRGLGATQTLILIDGHRATPRGAGGDTAQPDLNGIPLSAIERIEVLPTTASGIYGGGATGGVINVVLRRDYTGLEAKVTYEDSFAGGGANRRVDFGGGFDLEGGRTNVMLTGSYSDGSELFVGDRNFTERARAALLRNNPGAISGAAAPLLGGTSNICSATILFPGFALCNSDPLTLQGGTSLGSPITSVPYGYAGIASDNGAGLGVNAGRYNLDLANTAQFGGGRSGSLLNGPKIRSFTATIRRDITTNVHAFAEISDAKNEGSFSTSFVSGTFVLPAGSSGNPFVQDIQVTTSAFGTDGVALETNESRRALAGLIFDLPAAWRGEADYTWGRTRFSNTQFFSSLNAAAADAVANGTLDVFRDTNEFPVDFSSYVDAAPSVSPADTTMNDVTVRLSGPLPWTLPAGSPTVALALEHRKEALDDYVQVFPFGDSVFTFTSNSRSQAIDSAYLESHVPLISAQNGIAGAQSLELMLAVRRDQYVTTGANQSTAGPGIDPDAPVRVEDRFASTDPTVGLRYQPVIDVALRASYGTGFLPPPLSQLVPGQSLPGDGFGLTDPLRDNEPIGAFTTLTGGNPGLRPERSITRSAGVVLTPRIAPGLRLSLDWTRISKHDNVQGIVFDQNAVDNEALYPGLITRGPASDGFPVGPIAVVNGRPINVARQEVEAYDFTLDYQLQTPRWGRLSFFGAATRNLHNRTQVIATLPQIESAGFGGNNDWIANASVIWDYRQWALQWTARYFDAYWLLIDHDVLPSQGSAKVERQTYHDASATYAIGGANGLAWLNNVEFQLGIRNVFNEVPPLDFSQSDPFYSTQGDPRLRSFYVVLKKSFE